MLDQDKKNYKEKAATAIVANTWKSLQSAAIEIRGAVLDRHKLKFESAFQLNLRYPNKYFSPYF